MNKAFLVLFVVIFCFVGCSKECRDQTSSFNLPKELEGYRIYRLNGDDGQTLYVIIPPNVAESKPVYLVKPLAKNVIPTVIVIDGKNYNLVEE